MLELRNVSFAVNDTEEKEIVRNLSLTVESGKFVVITGPNGGGKSTLAKLIAGIEKPTEGQIFLDGEDITGLSVTERAKLGIGYAFQQPVKFKGIRVFDLLKIASGQAISVNEACAYLSEVGLCAKDYIEREVNASLSGGELKRIEILVRIFEKLQKETQDSSILVISHQERILEIADEIIVLSGGTVEQMGTRDEILPKILGTEAAASSCARLSDRRD